MNGPVRSADRALMIFEAFAESKRQMNLREIAAACDLPISSCHALVQTLLQRGYLYALGRRKELYPNRRILKLARTIVDHDPFLARFSSDLEALRDECNETVTVAKRQGDELQYIYTLECERPIRYASQPGDFRPLHSTAGGKALLSALSEEELDAWLERSQLEATTSKTITNARRLRQAINSGRKLGYFLGCGEYADDLDAIAVPIQLHEDVICVSLVGPSQRMRPLLPRLSARLLRLKEKLENTMEADIGFDPMVAAEHVAKSHDDS